MAGLRRRLECDFGGEGDALGAGHAAAVVVAPGAAGLGFKPLEFEGFKHRAVQLLPDRVFAYWGGGVDQAGHLVLKCKLGLAEIGNGRRLCVALCVVVGRILQV